MNRASHRFVLVGVAVACFVVPLGCEPAPLVRPGVVPQTSRLGISDDGGTLYVALADHDEVRAIDARTFETKQTVTVPGHPHRLTVRKDGTVAVTARAAGTVSVLDMDDGEVLSTTEVGSDPFGVVEVDGALVVAVAGEGDLARVVDGRVVSRVALDADDPRGLAVSGGKLVVSHFSAGTLSIVDLDSGLDSGRAAVSVPMKLRSRSFFTPNQFDQITVDPEDPAVVVAPHVECNNDPAQFGTGSTAFVGTPAAVYYNSGPTGFPAVVPAISRADVDAGLIISDDGGTADDGVQAGAVAEPAGPASPLINPLNRTLLASTNVNGPVAVALADDGRLELIVALGSGNVVVRRSVLQDGEDSIIGAFDVGVGAEAIVLSPDGATGYVFNGFDQSVTRFDVPQTRGADTRFDDGRKAANPDEFLFERHAPMRDDFGQQTFTIAEQALSADVVRGRTLFHAVDQRLTQNGAISCASCHPGGGDDGTTWSFAEGPRQSPALWGGLLGTEPFHWDQAVRDMPDISRVTIIGRMGGTGLGTADMNAIGAFLDQIPAPAPRLTAQLATESVARGAEVFVAIGCTGCHSGADLTDGRSHIVGTGRNDIARETMDAFATPALKGLVHTAPYLHDGSAHTVRDVVEQLVVTNKMIGTGIDGASLTTEQLDDLVAYLESI